MGKHRMQITNVSVRASSGAILVKENLEDNSFTIKRDRATFATVRFILRPDPDNELIVLVEGERGGLPPTKFVVPFPEFETPSRTHVTIMRTWQCKCDAKIIAEAYYAYVSYNNGDKPWCDINLDWSIEDKNLVADLSIEFDDDIFSGVHLQAVVEGVL